MHVSCLFSKYILRYRDIVAEKIPKYHLKVKKYVKCKSTGINKLIK